ncbi:unnamed protein product [Acanthoscelides obtectus]|uniref:Chromo domain-containing protein n=1 Tax=Acanthoscelides obtectus TaxID=200917 RepID=A0A9P0KGU2_ACAOB|nr:unnamed protein product [Acanthoscelides obtectus]CAK1636048.1 Chromobox protein homolog 5 [Acanthoscelides obtectus]
MKRKSGRKSKAQDENGSNGVEENGADSEIEETPKKKRSASPRKSKKDDASSINESADSDNSDEEKSKKDDPDEDPLGSAENDETASEGKKSKRGKKSTQKEPKSGDEDDENQNENKKSKKSRKSAQKDDVVQDEEDESQYEVEKVLDEKMVKGVRHYLIRWKGYEEESDTWEPENTLNCTDLIKDFKEQKKNKKTAKPAKTKKKAGSENAEADWDENEDFEVERILDVYFKRDGSREFLVSWKGYGTADNSWEPEEHMSCRELIDKFMKKVERAREVDERELRVKRQPVQRFTLSTQERERRLSKRLTKKERVQYHDAE